MRDVTPPAPQQVLGRRVAPGQGNKGDFTYTVVEIAPRSGGEQRNDRRIPTRLHEGVIAERGRPVVDCRIRDRSREGARLQLDKQRPLPRTFLLTDTASRGRFWATVMWQKGRDVGVKLVPA